MSENRIKYLIFSHLKGSHSTIYYEYRQFVPLSYNLWIADLFDVISSEIEAKKRGEYTKSKNGKIISEILKWKEPLKVTHTTDEIKPTNDFAW